MSIRVGLTGLILSSAVAFGQSLSGAPASSNLQAPTTLPIVFTNSVDAAHAHSGDAFTAKTSQVVRLSNGTVIPAGTKISCHVVEAQKFVYDETPYAHQHSSVLSVRFDSLQLGGETLPLNVQIRAAADPLTSEAARTPNMPSDADPQGTTTQIGGDQYTPSQSKVYSSDGDVVAYNKRGGVYAHLISSGSCDGSSTEVSVGIYSASACGLYGFAAVSAAEMGTQNPSVLTLTSTHVSPKIWKNTTALLEVIQPQEKAVASR